MADGNPTSATVIGAGLPAGARNVCMMHALERIAGAMNASNVPLLVLKGGALNLTVHDRPDERPMGDLDVMVRPEDLRAAIAALEGLGAVRGQPLVRQDFFPRFYHETEFKLGDVCPVRIDLHVRPFRPLRYAQRVPDDALWARACPVRIGGATVLIPSAEDMLVHLAAHSAFHGNARRMWRADIHRWVDARRSDIDWDRFCETVEAWGLTWPVLDGIRHAQTDVGPVCPPAVLDRLSRRRVGWRDRLALAQAPRDASHPAAHVAVNVICTRGWRFALAYLWAVAFPDRVHMGQWYPRRHRAWLPTAHLMRCCWPVIGRIPRFRKRFSKIETPKRGGERIGVFAKQDIQPGEVIGPCRVRVASDPGSRREKRSGEARRYEVIGELSGINHSDRPNARLSGHELVALRPIRTRQEITIDMGAATNDGGRTRPSIRATLTGNRAADAA